LPESCLAGPLALVEGAEDRNCHDHAGAGVAERGAGLDGRAIAVARRAGHAAGGLGDHVEGEALLVGAALSEALDLAVDDAGVELLHRVVGQAEPLDRAGRHVLDHDVALLQQLAHDLEAARRLEVHRQGLLVGVELVEVPGIGVRLAPLQTAPGIAEPRVLDLHHLGTEPGQGLGAGWPGLELGEVDDANAFQTVKLHTVGHARSPGPIAPGPDRPILASLMHRRQMLDCRCSIAGCSGQPRPDDPVPRAMTRAPRTRAVDPFDHGHRMLRRRRR
jgi:hypothetical protein